MKHAASDPRPPSWSEVAAELALEFPRARLEPAVVRWADANSPRSTWGVAFSGGADSLALLLLLWAHWPERRARLRALHFDHRLRGAASRADAMFCRRVCAQLGVPFVSDVWRDAPAAPSEAAARAARMEFFRRHARVIWFGHQQDDVAESLLMRLARGSGAGGLAAPRPVQRIGRDRVHLRPLLGIKKAELIAALQRRGVTWCDDATNAGLDYFRNRIRASVLPAWNEAAQRDAIAGAARTRTLLEEDDDALAAWLAELKPFPRPGVLATSVLKGRPRALWRRALHGWLLTQPRAGELSRVAFETLLAALERGTDTRHSLGRECFAVLRRGELRFERG